jgi:putative protease
MEKKPPVPAVTGQKVGVVIHYYTHLGVAVIRLDQGQLQVGDTIHVKGHTTDFKQTVESMEVEHQKIQRATAGQEFGLKVVDHAREHDEVYKVMG